ncbi:MAG: efflux RND transporter permease subunit [Krumholzibacteria bacterium]|nr:efflux RND transporter permease subunit [Candidatus Krumholzibacteria bacterium]
MNLTRGAIRRYPMIFAFMTIIAIMGVSSYLDLPRESSPDVKIPYVMVIAPYAGTSPEDMENLVTRKLEKELKGLEDLKEMTSSSSYGMSSITLEFESKVDMSDALQSVRDRVELAKPDLPVDPRNDLIVQEVSAADAFPVMQVNLAGDIDLFVLKKMGEDLQEELEKIRGVLGIDLVGGIENEVQVDVDPEQLVYHDLSLQDVQDAVALQNVTIPGGKLSLGVYDYQVRVPGEVGSPAEILDFVVNPGIDPPVYLRDVATVTFGVKDRETISRVNGKDAVTLVVKKRSGENIIAIADEVRAAIERLRPSFPERTEISIVADQSVQIQQMVGELENNILSGLVLVVVVLLAFFGFRNAVFVGLAIPFSMLITFIVLNVLGITLNMVVLFSLILALGMLVDNAIVIVENIYRQRSKGKEAEEAAEFGARQVTGAVVASTLTTICAFGPIAFWPGIMGEFMRYLPVTVIITLSASLLVALVFNPVLCARFMAAPRQVHGAPRLGDRLIALGLRSYRPTLLWALRHRFPVLLGINLLLVVVVVLFGLFNAGVELFPDVEPQFAMVNIDAPSGTRIDLTDSYAAALEAEVAGIGGDLKAYATAVGVPIDNQSGGGTLPGHQAQITMEFVDQADRTVSSWDALEALRGRLAGFTGARLTVDRMEEGPPTGKPVNIEITGDDFDVLGELAARVGEEIRAIPGLVDITDNYDRSLPELTLIPDVEKAGRFGLRTFDIAGTVRTALHGTEAAKYRVGEDEYDIVVRYRKPFRGKVEDLESATVFYEGRTIPVSAFATIEFTTGLAAVHRIDARRVVTVSGESAAGFNANALLAQVRRALADFELPAGYSLAFTGESEDQEEASAFLQEAFSVAIMLIFVVLVSQFSSVTVPVIILSSVILSLIGVLTGLMVTGTAFGIIMTGVGVISLAGIVVNNAIVLLDYIIQLRARGLEKHEAIVRAGETRFRPVVLTAITTILGLIPLTTGLSLDFAALLGGRLGDVLIIGGESSQWWGPMGVAVIWGLAVATFLTLVVVPVMYSTLEPIKRFLYRWSIGLFRGRRSAAG